MLGNRKTPQNAVHRILSRSIPRLPIRLLYHGHTCLSIKIERMFIYFLPITQIKGGRKLPPRLSMVKFVQIVKNIPSFDHIMEFLILVCPQTRIAGGIALFIPASAILRFAICSLEDIL